MAQKICPKCQKGNGPRTKTCECGHVFISDGVPASPKMMTLQPEPQTTDSQERKNTVQAAPNVPEQRASRRGTRIVLAPAGACNIKPRGYKDKWPDGPASDETVVNWAVDVYNSDSSLAVDAVVYWARNFWDINGKEFPRIVSLIHQAISVNQPVAASDIP